MIDSLRQYILSLICAALVSGILCDLAEKTSFRKPIRLAATLFVTITFLKPLIGLPLPQWEKMGDNLLRSAQAAAAEGENFRIRSVAGIIKDEAESYIQKEARSLGADITVEIEVSAGDPPVPESAVLQGTFDADSETELSRILAREFGIPKEHQTWIRQEPHASGSSSENTVPFF